MGLEALLLSNKGFAGPKIAYMRISSTTNSRTTIATYLRGMPAGDSVFFFIPELMSVQTACILSGLFSSLAFDVVIRRRLGGLNMSEFVMVEAPLPKHAVNRIHHAMNLLLPIGLADKAFAEEWLSVEQYCQSAYSWRALWSLTPAQRIKHIAIFNVFAAYWFGLTSEDIRWALIDCDQPRGQSGIAFDPKGFWRVDKDQDPELRHTVLTLIAFHDLEEKIRICGGDREKGIEVFLNQNDGEGWLLPKTLRLADYGLGHDERAKHPQPVATRLGPRFYDWQLTQSAEESWRECHIHARNLLGETGYRQLLEDIESPNRGQNIPRLSEPPAIYSRSKAEQGKLFE